MGPYKDWEPDLNLFDITFKILFSGRSRASRYNFQISMDSLTVHHHHPSPMTRAGATDRQNRLFLSPKQVRRTRRTFVIFLDITN